MITKLPPWVWTGAGILAFIAGMVNVVGLLGFDHQAVTHLTGTTSLMASAMARREMGEVWHLAAMVGSFVAGAILSGFLVRDHTLKLGRHYGVALFVESGLLMMAAAMLQHDFNEGIYAASAACGLQNAMVSTFSGAVVRTTHLSGLFTDLGILLGQAMRGLPWDRLRFKLCFTIITSFTGGGIAGSLAFPALEYATLYIPAALTGGVALLYALYCLRR